jgi:hypothetical protein
LIFMRSGGEPLADFRGAIARAIEAGRTTAVLRPTGFAACAPQTASANCSDSAALRQPAPSLTDLDSDQRQGVVGRNRGLRPGVDPGYVARPPWRILRGDRTTPTEIGGVPAAQVLGPKC